MTWKLSFFFFLFCCRTGYYIFMQSGKTSKIFNFRIQRFIATLRCVLLSSRSSFYLISWTVMHQQHMASFSDSNLDFGECQFFHDIYEVMKRPECNIVIGKVKICSVILFWIQGGKWEHCHLTHWQWTSEECHPYCYYCFISEEISRKYIYLFLLILFLWKCYLMSDCILYALGCFLFYCTFILSLNSRYLSACWFFYLKIILLHKYKSRYCNKASWERSSQPDSHLKIVNFYSKRS